MPPFGSSSGAEQASFLSVKVVPPLWKKAVEATNTYVMWVQIQDKVVVFSSSCMNENLRRRGRCEVPFSHTSGRNGHPGCSQNSTLAYTELATGTSSNTGNERSRPLHYLMICKFETKYQSLGLSTHWVYWKWNIFNILYSVTTLKSSISTIIHVSRVTLSGLPKRASNFQPMGLSFSMVPTLCRNREQFSMKCLKVVNLNIHHYLVVPLAYLKFSCWWNHQFL